MKKHRHMFALLLCFAATASVFASSEENNDGSAMTVLVSKLKSKLPAEVSVAVHALVDEQGHAIPALAGCLEDADIRLTCIEILSKIRAEHSSPVLLKKFEMEAKKKQQDLYFMAYIAGALGRLKEKKAVVFLETLYQKQADPEAMLSSGIAWALKEITGKEYGPAFDPWRQGKSSFVP